MHYLERSGIQTPLRILSNSRRQFTEQASNPKTSWYTHRGLRPRTLEHVASNYISRETWIGYIDLLPTFEGKNIIELISGEIYSREEEARRTGILAEPVVIVDVGYGNGQFLLDSRKEWGDKVRLVGFGPSVYTRNEDRIWSQEIPNAQAILPPTEPALKESEVELVEGNVIDIRKILGDNFADFVVSSQTLKDIPYPQWELLKKLYRILKPSGVALLHYDYRAVEMISPILGYLLDNSYRFKAEEDGIAFKKTKDDITLPVRTINWNRDPEIKISTPQRLIA